MTDREFILGQLPVRELADPSPAYEMKKEPIGDTLALFTASFEALGGKIATWGDLARITDRNWVVDASVGEIPELAGPFVRVDAWSAGVGITRADVGIAETGSTLVNHLPEDHRLASLAPPMHVSILRISDLVFSLEEGLSQLNSRNSVIITGPSRTADIEGVLVRGVHGPKNTWIIFE